jgi:hypothetical protein
MSALPPITDIISGETDIDPRKTDARLFEIENPVKAIHSIKRSLYARPRAGESTRKGWFAIGTS